MTPLPSELRVWRQHVVAFLANDKISARSRETQERVLRWLDAQLAILLTAKDPG